MSINTQQNNHRGWGMNVMKTTIQVGMIVAMLFSTTMAWAELPQHVTEQFGEVLETDIHEVEGSWVDVSPESRVQINTMTQEVGFQIVGLPTGTNSLVKGIVVCQAGNEAHRVDTPGVQVNANGVAEFNGSVQLPQACGQAPQDLAFFVRTFAASL